MITPTTKNLRDKISRNIVYT